MSKPEGLHAQFVHNAQTHTWRVWWGKRLVTVLNVEPGDGPAEPHLREILKTLDDEGLVAEKDGSLLEGLLALEHGRPPIDESDWRTCPGCRGTATAVTAYGSVEVTCPTCSPGQGWGGRHAAHTRPGYVRDDGTAYMGDTVEVEGWPPGALAAAAAAGAEHVPPAEWMAFPVLRIIDGNPVVNVDGAETVLATWRVRKDADV